MKTIEFFPLLHRRAEQIGIRFENDERLNQTIQKVKGVKWSRTHRCWYIKCSKEGFDTVYNLLKALGKIDTTALKEFMPSQITADKVVVDPQSDKLYKPGTTSKVVVLNEQNQAALSKFIEQLKLKAYSYATIKTYRSEFLQLLKLLKHKPVNDLTTDDLRRYMVYAMEKEGIRENTAHSRINALKFYFEQVLGREKFFWEIPRPKKPLLLPKVLGEEELSRLFKALRNKKHKAVLFTAYSAGLRVSEVANLKIADIDSDRMQIRIEAAKGKKDRYVNLSPLLLDILRDYVKTYKPRPKKYLFESEKSGEAYPTRTLQRIFELAKENAGISKNVGIHSLRHSFATHLLEKGTDIYYIKDILGHFNIKTTERYLHVSKKLFVNITSPLDDLYKKGKIEW